MNPCRSNDSLAPPSSFRRHFSEALARVTAALGLPFGYTLTVWASSALATHDFGAPDALRVVAFVGGAVLVYAVFDAAEYKEIEAVETLRARRVVMFNAVAVVAAGIVTAVDRLVDEPLMGWLLSGALATATDIALLALLWAWHAARGETIDPREPPA